MNVSRLEELVAEDLSMVKIAKTLECSASTIQYWLRKLDIKTTAAKTGKRNPWGNPLFAKCNTHGFKLGEDSRRFSDEKRPLHSEKLKQNWAEKPFESRGLSVKRKIIINEQLGKCNNCGIDSWLKNLISFQLHHKNGNNRDDSRENLEALCPNCHSQTENFGFKKRKHTVQSREKMKNGCHAKIRT